MHGTGGLMESVGWEEVREGGWGGYLSGGELPGGGGKEGGWGERVGEGKGGGFGIDGGGGRKGSMGKVRKRGKEITDQRGHDYH